MPKYDNSYNKKYKFNNKFNLQVIIFLTGNFKINIHNNIIYKNLNMNIGPFRTLLINY